MTRVLLIAALMAAFSYPAAAQEPLPGCPATVERAKLLEWLGTHYSERPAFIGLSADNLVLEVLTADGGKTWTIILTRPSGQSCVAAVGEAWQSVPRIIPNGAPA